MMLRTRAQRREARNRIREGGEEAKKHKKRKKRKKSQKSYTREVETGETWAEGERRRQESVGSAGSVDVDPKDLENRKEAKSEAHGDQGLSNNCRERVSPLSRLIVGFRNRYH